MGKNSELLKEKLPHGNVLFPLMVHEVSSNPKITERLACHWHTEYEFLVITKGCAQFQIENQIIPVKENDIVFIKSDDLHAITTTCGMPLDFYAIVFHPDLLNSHLGDAIWQKYIEPVNTGLLFFPSYISPNENWGMALLQNLNKIKDLFERKEMGYELLIKCAIYEIWYILYTHAAQNISAHEKDQTHKITRIKSMITWLQAHYTESISLEQMAYAFHISQGQLCRFFKGMTQMSVIEYLNYYRISKSIQLLDSTDKQISEIALDVGFNNISYYNKIFKYYIHMTPMVYRKSNSLKRPL